MVFFLNTINFPVTDQLHESALWYINLFNMFLSISFSAVARPNGQPRQAGVARGVRGHVSGLKICSSSAGTKYDNNELLLVITKGYRVRATMIEGQTLLLQ